MYESEGEDIAVASRRTVERMATLLPPIESGTRIADLGAGYGGAACQLARRYGCEVVCLNLSEVQNRRNREFIAGVLLAPVAVSTLWMTVFGNSALFREREAPGGFAGAAQEEMLFALLDGLPLSPLTSTVAIVVVILFFVTSSDSGSLVIDMLASGGNPNPAKIQRVFWAVTEGAVATVLLLAGGLNALQAAAIGTGLPFTPVLLVMCWCLWRALRSEPPLPDRVARLQRGSHRSET